MFEAVMPISKQLIIYRWGRYDCITIMFGPDDHVFFFMFDFSWSEVVLPWAHTVIGASLQDATA